MNRQTQTRKEKQTRKIRESFNRKPVVPRCPLCGKPMMLVDVSSKVGKQICGEVDSQYVCIGRRMTRDNEILPVSEYGLPVNKMYEFIRINKGRYRFADIAEYKRQLTKLFNFEFEANAKAQDEHYNVTLTDGVNTFEKDLQKQTQKKKTNKKGKTVDEKLDEIDKARTE